MFPTQFHASSSAFLVLLQGHYQVRGSTPRPYARCSFPIQCRPDSWAYGPARSLRERKTEPAWEFTLQWRLCKIRSSLLRRLTCLLGAEVPSCGRRYYPKCAPACVQDCASRVADLAILIHSSRVGLDECLVLSSAPNLQLRLASPFLCSSSRNRLGQPSSPPNLTKLLFYSVRNGFHPTALGFHVACRSTAHCMRGIFLEEVHCAILPPSPRRGCKVLAPTRNIRDGDAVPLRKQACHLPPGIILIGQ